VLGFGVQLKQGSLILEKILRVIDEKKPGKFFNCQAF
jgi:hypothetical protein